MSVQVNTYGTDDGVMGTLVLTLHDPGSQVSTVRFRVTGADGVPSAPVAADRVPSPGVYEKDVPLAHDTETLIEPVVTLAAGGIVPAEAQSFSRISGQLLTLVQGSQTERSSSLEIGAGLALGRSADGRRALLTGTGGSSTGGTLAVQDADTAATPVGTLVFQGTVVSVASGVATFDLDGRYATRTGLTAALASYYTRAESDGRYLTPTAAAGSYYTKAESDGRYSAVAHTHPYLPLAGGLLTGMLRVQKNTGTISYDTGHAELRTTDGSAVGVGFHRSGFTAVTLRHAINGALDLIDHNGAWAQYRGGSFYAAGNRFYGSDGAFIDVTNGAALFLTSGAAALQARVGSLLVSDDYTHAPNVPANGIWARGNIVSAGSVSAAGGKLSTGGASGGILLNARQANTHAWEIYNSGGTLGWHSGQYSVDAMTLTQGGLLAVPAITARDQVTVQGTMRFANGAHLQANRTDGTLEGVFWPRWTDNNTYLNYGSGGHFYIRDNASNQRLVFAPDGTGFTTWVQARGVNGHDLRLGGSRAPDRSWISSSPNLHLDSPTGYSIFLNYESDRPVNIGAIYQTTHKLAVNGDAILHNNGWFRNAAGGTGLYNEGVGRHLFAGWDGHNSGWNIAGGAGETFLALRDIPGSAPRGWLFANGEGFGLLHGGRQWAVRSWNGGGQLHGNWNANGTFGAGRVYSGFDSGIDGSVSASNWFRSSGTTGWYNATYETGIYSDQSGYVRTYGQSGIKVGVNGVVSGNPETTDSTFGLYFGADRSAAYGIYRAGGGWSHPYPDLRIAFHTGVQIGANTGYGGTRFYSDYDMATELMSVGNTDGNVRIANSLFVSGTVQVSGNFRVFGSPTDVYGNSLASVHLGSYAPANARPGTLWIQV